MPLLFQSSWGQAMLLVRACVCVCVCDTFLQIYSKVQRDKSTSGFKGRQKHFQANFSAQIMKLGQFKWSVQAVEENTGARIRNY